MSHLTALVPNALLDKLPHCAHVKALKSGKIDAELGVRMLTKEPADFCELISNTDIKGLFVRLISQDHSTRGNSHSFVVHSPAYLSNVVLICKEVLICVTVTDRYEGLRFPYLSSRRGLA